MCERIFWFPGSVKHSNTGVYVDDPVCDVRVEGLRSCETTDYGLDLLVLTSVWKDGVAPLSTVRENAQYAHSPKSPASVPVVYGCVVGTWDV